MSVLHNGCTTSTPPKHLEQQLHVNSQNILSLLVNTSRKVQWLYSNYLPSPKYRKDEAVIPVSDREVKMNLLVTFFNTRTYQR